MKIKGFVNPRESARGGLIGKRSIYNQKLGAAATPFKLILENIKILPIR